MKIKRLKGEFADVETGRLTRTINIQMLPHIKAGDYVIVHAGFAIERLDPEKAEETLKLIVGGDTLSFGLKDVPASGGKTSLGDDEIYR